MIKISNGIFTLFFIVLLISSCGEEETKPICDVNISDICNCPEETHYAFLDWDQPECLPKKDNKYRAKFTGENCLTFGLFDDFDKIGLMTLHFPYSGGGNGISARFGGYHGYIGSGFGCEFVDFILSDNDDGSQNVKFKYVQCSFHKGCLDWEERTDCTLLSWGGVIGHCEGKSNADRSKYEIDIEWKDCHDVVLDKGHLSLWQ
ncbi:MAG: hypothetical protein V3V14_11350 [Saprospiraceae bacterium]